MTIFDIVCFSILGLFFILSFFRGLVRELFSFLGYLVGYIIAINYNTDMATLLENNVSKDFVAKVSEFTFFSETIKILVTLIIFFFVKYVVSLLGQLIKNSINGKFVLTFPDRLLGSMVGLLKGVILIAIIIFPLSLFEVSYKKITRGSIFAPYMENIIAAVSRGTYKDDLIKRIPDISLNEFKDRVMDIEKIKVLTKDIDKKKDDLIDSVKELVENEKIEETYTTKDKNELKKLLKALPDN